MLIMNIDITKEVHSYRKLQDIEVRIKGQAPLSIRTCGKVGSVTKTSGTRYVAESTLLDVRSLLELKHV